MNNQILETSRPRVSIKDFTLDEIISFLRGALSKRENVREAFLFGSLAKKQEGYWSDVDILIVAEVDAPFVERPRQFFDLLDLGVPVDILVYTPQEFEALKNSQSGFWRSFAEKNVRIL
jgi:predicted nucleotidyltransferase